MKRPPGGHGRNSRRSASRQAATGGSRDEAVYRRRAGDYLARNGGFLVRGYGEWLVRYALRAAAPVAHPLFHGPSDGQHYAARPYGEA